MAKIHVMDEILANKIAAGEVVEKCVNVVKELVENSIDADSTDIKVELQEAGTKFIKVTDNGSGMDYDDAIMAFARHATSKIIDENDLFNIRTLGFRGEALASIASVSKVVMYTGDGEIGTKVVINGGKIEEKKKCEAIKGTSITVSDLFYNTPARLKHMKSLYTELAHITEYMNKIALSHPDIRFTLINNGRVLLKTDGSGNMLKVIHSIFGYDITKKMLKISGENLEYTISGYTSLPEVHRSSKNGIIILVNGRVVYNTQLVRTINDSYHSYKPDNYYPITVLNITVDPQLIDVNIHPTKMDIKFSKMEELCKLINDTIKSALQIETLIPEVDVVLDETVNYDISSDSPKQEIRKEHYEQEKIDLSTQEVEEEVTDLFKEIEQRPQKIEIQLRLPQLYVVGLVHGTYIVCENEEGMYLIDQHAANERINYEKILKKLANPTKETIAPLYPITLEFSNNDYIVLKHNLYLLTDMGFKIEEFGVNSIIIKEHPTWLNDNNALENIKRLIEMVINLESNFKLERFRDSLAALMACKRSIKANTSISKEEMESLIANLRLCDNPFTCPHGRPTIIKYTNYDLEKLFKRSGF